MSRAKQPQLTPRGRDILEAIYSFDGVLDDYQILHLFYKNALRTAQIGMEKLAQLGLVELADRTLRARLGRRTYFLTREGASEVAQRLNCSIHELGYRKMGERPAETAHDLEINDFHLAVLRSCRTHGGLAVVRRIGSREFARDYDTITYTYTKGGHPTRDKRRMQPDSYFVIQGKDAPIARFLLEIDRGTESHARIAREKLHAQAAYIMSGEYKARFGFNAGRWLYVTTTPRRRAYMQEVARRELGAHADLFYFTTRDKVAMIDKPCKTATFHDVLNTPIWFQGGAGEPVTLAERYAKMAL